MPKTSSTKNPRCFAVAFLIAFLLGATSAALLGALPNYDATPAKNPPAKTVILTGSEWNTNAVFAVNREDPHANFVPYGNEKAALENFTLYKEKSDLYQSLDGMWRFHWAHCPAERPTTDKSAFTSLKFDDSGWDLIKVPLNWQANFKANGDFKYDGYIFNTAGVSWGGTFRHPVTSANITNGQVTQPAAPSNYNPVGTYRRTFVIPKAWKKDNRSISVLFDAVGSNCYVWVNGHAVGYAEDSFAQKEFDITPFVNYEGNNVIVVQVFRWCSGSWFETQDMNRLSGIFRSVGLVARAKVNLYDVQTLTTPVADDAYGGEWNLNVKALLRDWGASAAQKNSARLEAKLFDDANREVAKAISVAAPAFETRKNLLGDDYIGASEELNIKINGPKLWSAEHPNLYKLVLTMYDGKTATETTCFRVGFRQAKIVNMNTRNVRFLLNGSRIVLHGVNQHESNPESGFTQNLDLIRKDISLMKQLNVNSLRMSHYPHDTRYYDLCDEYGLYVMDEANIECHGANSVVSSQSIVKSWGPLLRDRINTTMSRDWNYPCVIIWSTGNENMEIKAAEEYRAWTVDFMKAKDASRSAHSQYLQNASNSTSDTGPHWHSGMYATVSRWDTIVNDAVRPTLQCEYAHAYGNSLGNFDEYMAIFERPKTSGGYVWDWVDQALWTPVKTPPYEGYNGPSRFLGFGGDWGGEWGSGSSHISLACNGLVNADRTPQPETEQLKYGYRMLKADGLDLNTGTFNVSNKFSFTNANQYDMYWELKENGAVIQNGSDTLDIGPAPTGVAETSMTTKTFNIPFTRPGTVKPGAEYFFNVVFKEKVDTLWAKAGHVISENQLVADFRQGRESSTMPIGAMSLVEDSESVTISSTDTGSNQKFKVSISKADGTISEYKFMGRDLLIHGPAPNFWRPVNDNERAWYTGGTNTNPTFLVNGTWRATGSSRAMAAGSFKVESEEKFSADLGSKAISLVKVCFDGSFPNKVDAAYSILYTVYPNGEVNVEHTYRFGTQTANNNFAPEIGSIMTVKPEFENITWFGPRGETYSDRKTGYPVGQYESTVTGNFFNYVRTQETGMKVDVRWFAMTDDAGFGFLVKGGGTMPAPPNGPSTTDTSLIQFNALHYAPEDLTPPPGNDLASLSQKPHQLKKRDDITLRVAIASTGLGGDNSWGAYPMDAYRINVNNMTYRFNYSILPIQALDSGFATAYAHAPYNPAANEMQKKIMELSGQAAKKQPADATTAATIAEAKELATADFALMSELQKMHNKLDALLR
ncbi:MAG: DUF4981 domain-containing protein [Holophagales bacterium]|nr:DUF4981 domain-containing protein [Holophagales bacterium]